jgi:hypothetical protein
VSSNRVRQETQTRHKKGNVGTPKGSLREVSHGQEAVENHHLSLVLRYCSYHDILERLDCPVVSSINHLAVVTRVASRTAAILISFSTYRPVRNMSEAADPGSNSNYSLLRCCQPGYCFRASAVSVSDYCYSPHKRSSEGAEGWSDDNVAELEDDNLC